MIISTISLSGSSEQWAVSGVLFWESSLPCVLLVLRWWMVSLSCYDVTQDIWGQHLHCSLGTYQSPHTFGNISYFILYWLLTSHFSILNSHFSSQGFPPSFERLEVVVAGGRERNDELCFPQTFTSHQLSERKQVLGQLNLVISELFLQQVFKHPAQHSPTGNTMHWVSPLGISKLKTYFLVYKVFTY